MKFEFWRRKISKLNSSEEKQNPDVIKISSFEKVFVTNINKPKLFSLQATHYLLSFAFYDTRL